MEGENVKSRAERKTTRSITEKGKKASEEHEGV